MTHPVTGMFAGILLAIAAASGFGWFLLAIVFGAVGYVVAGQLSGELDLRTVFSGRNRG